MPAKVVRYWAHPPRCLIAMSNSVIGKQVGLQGRGHGVASTKVKDALCHRQPYDCSADLNNWQEGWSQGMIAWCCQHKARGCNGATTSICPTQDCGVAWNSWRAAWTPEKKTWCCQHEGKACP